MTLNTSNGVPPPLNLQHPTHNPHTSSRRRNTIGSPTSAVFTPASASNNIIHPPASVFAPLPLLSPPRDPLLNGYFPSGGAHFSGYSLPSKPVSPNRRRQNSRSPDRGRERALGISGGWTANGRKNHRQHNANPKVGTPSMPGKKDEIRQQQPIASTSRPSFRTHKSNVSTQSNSLPSTPNHHARNMNGSSRTPSPPSCLLDSPRSAASEPVVGAVYTKPTMTGCIYETALVNARRRMPYSLGIEKLNKEKPKQEYLRSEQEEKLSGQMAELYKHLKPDEDCELRKRKFLTKLERILNNEWPNYNIKVHAFGSTENHLCMKDSDVDVCITTPFTFGIQKTCTLAAVLAKHGMERVVCVPGAKVPIVKIWDPEFEVACDMNVNNTLALDNTKMIKTYVEIDDRVRPLAIILKYWTKRRILNDAAAGGTLSSYTWICLILSFLQTRDPPILPALHQRPHKKKPPNNGVDISFDDDIASLRGFGKQNKETLGELLFAFFKKYGHELDYEKKVISVRQGKLLSKEEKRWQYLQNNRLCVEEPFNVGRNLGNTADDSSMRGIHLEFRRAHRILSEKADLAEVCEQYEFPPEEPHFVLPQQAPSRPVTMSRSNSNHGKNRNGYNGNMRGGRGYGWNNRQQQSRRASSGAAYNHAMLQPQFYPPELFGYLANTQEHLYALQAQINAHAQAQAQLAHVQAAQAHAHAHLQNPQQNQQGQQNSHQSSNGAASANGTPSQDSVTPYQLTWPYFAQLYGMHMFYPSVINESSANPTSPPRTPAMPDNRPDAANDAHAGINHGGRRNGSFSPGSRSRSQPPPLYTTTVYNSRGPQPHNMPSSEEEDFGDHSSNGNPPETPPEDEPDEYVGYYSIGGSLHSDVAVIDEPVDEDQEPFIEQKSLVDRQKRLSTEKLPPMLGKSNSTSPVLNARPNIVDNDIPAPLSLDDRPVKEPERGPVIVNGSFPRQQANHPTLQSLQGLPNALHDETQAPTSSSLKGVDGSSDSMVVTSNGFRRSSENGQIHARKSVEAQKKAHRNESTSASSVKKGTIQQQSDKPLIAGVSAVNGSINGSVSSETQNKSATKNRDPEVTEESANQRQRAAPKHSSRSSASDSGVKNHGVQEGNPPLTPVLEVPTPPPTSIRKGDEVKAPNGVPKANTTNSQKNTSKNDTPPSKADKPAHKQAGRTKTNGKGSSGQHNSKAGSESKSEQKPPEKSWKQSKNKKPKKRTPSGPKPDAVASVNESERKGG